MIVATVLTSEKAANRSCIHIHGDQCW